METVNKFVGIFESSAVLLLAGDSYFECYKTVAKQVRTCYHKKFVAMVTRRSLISPLS
jgi:hypothetical protein